MNFLEGTLNHDGLTLGRHWVELPHELRRALARGDGDVVVGLRPEDIRPAENDAADDGLDAEIVITEQLGPEVLVYLRIDGIRVASVMRGTAAESEESADLRETLIARLPGDAPVRPGQRLRVTLNRAAVNLFDPVSGESLLPR